LTCLRTKSSLEPEPEGNKYAGGQSQSGRAERPRRVAPVVKVAEAPRSLVVVVPFFTRKFKKNLVAIQQEGDSSHLLMSSSWIELLT
jgi:hypothetical protein